LNVTTVRLGEAIKLEGALGPLCGEGVADALRWTVKAGRGRRGELGRDGQLSSIR
jgi:hypothetical protein